MRNSLCKKLIFSFILLSGSPLFADTCMATTLWVKGIVELAGIDSVTAFAPADMKHPSEYELSPSDILALSKADTVFIAGYEKKMVEKINESFSSSGKKFRIFRVSTDNSLSNLKKEAERIAHEFGTERKMRTNISELEGNVNGFRKAVMELNTSGARFYVHTFQMPLITSFGIDAAGTFGPSPATVREIQQVSKLKSVIIVDNIHNPAGGPLSDTNPNSRYIALLNFPGLFGTKSVADVIKYNEAQIRTVLTQQR